MLYFNTFIYNPGDQNEVAGGSASDAKENLKDSSAPDAENIPEKKEHKTVMEKIKEALQDWSDKDERDQEFDDTRV